MSQNLGIVAADTNDIQYFVDSDFLYEKNVFLDEYSSVICFLKKGICPKELYRLVINNNIAVLIIAYGTVIDAEENVLGKEQIIRNLESVCDVLVEQ